MLHSPAVAPFFTQVIPVATLPPALPPFRPASVFTEWGLDPYLFLVSFWGAGIYLWGVYAAIDTLLRAAAAETDQAKRKTLYEDANLKIHDAVLAVPLVHRTPPLVFGADLTGYTASPLQTVLTRVVVPGSDRLVFGHPEDAAKLDPADVTDGESLLATWHIYEGLTRYKAGSTVNREKWPKLAAPFSPLLL